MYSLIIFSSNIIASVLYSDNKQKLHFHKHQSGSYSLILINMIVEDYDAFALRNYSFAVRKTNSFFSLSTIVLSLGILVLAFFLNISNISHLWLPRSQLPIQASQSISGPGTLTSTLACYKSTNFTAVPTIKLLDPSLKQLNVQVIPQQTINATIPQLFQYIGRGFACIDLAGMTLNSTNRFFMEVSGPTANLYLKGTSYNEQIYGIFQPPMAQYGRSRSSSVITFRISFIQISISDQLSLNSQPQKQLTVQTKTNVNSSSTKPYATNNTIFAFQAYYPYSTTNNNSNNYNYDYLSITRYSLAYIIGTYLSWVSILSLVFGLIVGPIMEATFNLVVIQTLFHIEPNMQKPSAIRFILASVKSKLFIKEDRFVKLSQKLQKLKDIGFMLKLQFLLGRITVKKTQHDEIMISQHSFENVPKDIGLDLYSEKNNNSIDIMDGSPDQPKIGLLKSIRQKVLKAIDTGSDLVSISFEGKGYGSKFSLILSVIVGLGFIAFLMYFGTFKLSTKTSNRLILGKSSFSYTIQTSQLFFVTPSVLPVYFWMIDGNYNILGQAKVTSNTSYCLSLVPSSYQSYMLGQTIYCLSDPITLQYSDSPSANIMLRADISGVTDNYVYLFQIFNITQGNNLIPTFQNTVLTPYYDAEYTLLPMQLVYFSNSTLVGSYAQYLLPTAPFLSNVLTNNTQGVVLYLSSYQQIITTYGSVFDVVQNIWSFAIICFSVLLFKITKYINLREKEKVLSTLRSQYRDNICILMSKINGLLTGRNKAEIQNFKYYLKEPLSRHQE